jgi:hypothetical protein
VGSLALDDAGEEAVGAWLATSPDSRTIALVFELLQDLGYGRAFVA